MAFRNGVNSIIELTMIYKPLKTASSNLPSKPEAYFILSSTLALIFFLFFSFSSLHFIHSKYLKTHGKNTHTNTNISKMFAFIYLYIVHSYWIDQCNVLCLVVQCDETVGFRLKCVDFSLLQLFKCYISQHDRKCGKKNNGFLPVKKYISWLTHTLM